MVKNTGTTAVNQEKLFEWETVKLGDICTYQNGRALERYISNEGDYRVVSIGNYSTDGKYLKSESYISKKYKNEIKQYILNKNDLTMILNDKTSTGEILGRVLLIEENDSYIFNQRTMRLIVNKENVIPLYLYYKINSNHIHNKIFKMSKPGTQIYINTDDVINLKINIPNDIEEQRKIATVLSDMDDLIESLEKIIEKKKKIKQGTMQQLLTGEKRLPGYNKKWNHYKLNDLFSISAGKDLNIDDFSKEKNNIFKYPIYSNSLAKKGLYGYSSSYSYGESAITITARGTIGNANYRNGSFSAIGRLLVLMPMDKINLILVSEIINHCVNFRLESTGVPQLTAPKVEEYTIYIPTDPEEQQAIAEILSDMDAELEALEEKLEKYKKLKEGMMQELLTGRIRLV